LYYYKGCPSWGWYYPYHYAPFASDLYDLGVITVDFEKGQPFSPLSQLMGVLPTRSGHLVPAPYRHLMNEKDSPILDFYPLKFSEDLNGKKYSWQAIALLPFIDEKRLLIALEEAQTKLTMEERERDELGFDFLFVGLQNSLANDVSALYLKYQNVEEVRFFYNLF
jgi:5'-3' exoribonuclease 2